MKQSVGYGWAARLGVIVLVTLLALPVYAQLMLAHEGHHGAGGCVIETGEFPISFSAYEVPEGNLPPMHAFCESIPKLGKVNLSLELVNRETREIPLAVRLVREEHEGHGEGSSTTSNAMGNDGRSGGDASEHGAHTKVNASEHGIVYMPVQKHSSGIISIVATLTEKGNYAVLLERHDEAGNVTVAVRIPFSIGSGHGGHGGGFGILEIILLLAAGGGAYYYYMQRKKAGETPSDKS